MKWEKPSVSHHDHAQFVAEILHLVDLNKGPCVVNGIQTFHNIRLVTDKSQKALVL